jgi:spermidine synthase
MQTTQTRISLRQKAIVYIIFTASGSAALVYQMIWARWLSLVFGNTATSISIVLGSFMLGLALGSYLVGRQLAKIANPMLLYAYLELGIGIFAIGFPWLSSLVETIFTTTVNTNTSLLLSLIIRSILAFALLAIPTTLMGATLPLLTDFFRRHPDFTQSWKVGILYAANTFGAALGTLVASFILIETIGVRATTLIASVLNLVIAYLGFRLSKTSSLSSRVQSTESPTENNVCDNDKILAVSILTASGAIALASEVLWTRTLEILIGNSTYAFSLIVAIYLLGIAFGSWLTALVVNRLKSLQLWVVGVQVAMGLWLLTAIFLFTHIGDILKNYGNMPLSMTAFLWICSKAVSILFPLAFLSGSTFPIATKLMDPYTQEAQGVLIARAYAWNTIGAVIGSLTAGFIIAGSFDYFQAINLLSVGYGLTATIALLLLAKKILTLPRKTRYAAVILSIVSLSLTGVSLFYTKETSRFVSRVNKVNPKWQVAYHQPGLQGITTVLKNPDNPMLDILLINGKGMTIKATDTKMMAHLPMLAHPNPRKSLVICFGMGTTYRSAVSYGNQVTVVELVKEVFDAFDYFYTDAKSVRAYPKGRMTVNDGRNYLKLTEERFDVITVDPPPPIDAAGVTNLYSREFLELAKDRLTEGGIMAHWIPFPGPGAGVDDWTTFNMLLATFAEVYPYHIMLPGWNKIGMHVLGSMQPIQGSQDYFHQRLEAAPIAVKADLNELDQVTLSYFRPTAFEVQKNLILNTDDHPYLEFNFLRLLQTGTQKVYQTVYW